MAESPAPHPGSAERLHEYWVHGEGAAKIRWGTHGDFDRCTRQLEEHAHFTPEQAHGYCNLAHHAALGFYPATHAKMEKGSHRMTTYTRSFALEDISIRAGDGRTVDAFATVFDVPASISDEDGEYEEVNDRTMYNRALADAAPAGGRQSWRVGVFYNHGLTIWKTPSDLYSVPIGVPIEVRPEPRGLFTRTRYHPGELCDRILAAIHEGSLNSYSVSGAYLRSDPPVPRGGFRRSGGKLPTVRRMEASLREYGPTPFPAYAGAEVVGVRSEQVMTMLSMLAPDERTRLIDQFRSGAPTGERPAPDAPDDSGLVAEDSRRLTAEMRSDRSPKEMIRSARSAWIVRHGGDA